MEEKSLSDYYPLPESLIQYPLEFMENKGAIKLKDESGVITVGLTRKEDLLLQHELIDFHGPGVKFVFIPKGELTEYLSKRLSEAATQGPRQDKERLELDRLANDAPIVNLVNSLLLEGIRLGASDIHIESFETKVAVRYRIDGVLRLGRTLESAVFPGVSSRIKIMSHLNIIEKRLPQDGRMTVDLGGKPVEFRVSIIPIQEGESLVLRIFQKRHQIRSLEDLGFTPQYLEVLRRCGRQANGLLLVTGPTGSGKTTTLNGLLQELNSSDVKIITIEDPVENTLEGVNQVQTQENIGLTFESILRRLLRQDPDILMVGEIRDKKTAELAIRSALTGHLVLSTLHTNDALSAIPRLVNMGVEPYLLAGVLRGVSAQRLVRRVCPHCATETKPTPAEAAFFQKYAKVPQNYLQGKGCKVCHDTGFLGRLVLGEIFEIDQEAEELILAEKKKRDLDSYFKKKGSTFLMDDGFLKITQGLTTPQEVERAVLI